jgi:hypothetical protein
VSDVREKPEVLEATAFTIAQHAQSFLRAFAVMAAERTRLRQALQVNQSQPELQACSQLGNPSVVCLAFAAELGLKALLRDADVPFPRGRGKGHSLFALAALLPPARVERLLERLNCSSDELRQYLEIVDRTFEDWRYSYERGCLATHPDFLERLAHFAVDEFQTVSGHGKVPKVGAW